MEPEITVNGAKAVVDLTGVTHLAGAVDKLSKAVLAPGELIASLTVNGEYLEPGSPKAAAPIGQIKTIEVTTIKNPIEMTVSLLKRMGEYLSTMSPGVGKAADVLRLGSAEEGNAMLVKILDGITAFTDLIETAKSVARNDLGNLSSKGQTFTGLEERLLSMLKKVMDAQESSDWVMVADLLEYEIAPALDDWRNILPAVESELLKGNN
ncbi:MAG: hypothetical protein HZB29_11465 [Nitrospinae bacterium]|nr:hypothetical protein [Nitrospinota bacterium]